MSRRRVAALLLCSLALAGCASANAASPDWQPQPGSTLEPGAGPNVTPALPGPVPSGSASGSGAPSAAPSPGSTASPSQSTPTDPNVVATGLTAPVGLAVLPDGSAIVGERTTGRILHVAATAGTPATVVRTIPGLDASGDGGLLDLALSPQYAEDNLIYAYVTTPTDNRVVVFTLTGPITTVITAIPRGVTGNQGRIAFDETGTLLVGTGNAGQPALAANPASLAGKVLRLTPVGAPVGATPVFSSGHANSSGLCVDPVSNTAIQIERSTSGDHITALGNAVIVPTPSVSNAQQGLGGCAIASATLFLTSLNGQELLAAPLTATGSTVKIGTFTEALKGSYGRLITVVAAPDSTLWLTTSNKDGSGKPVPDDERVLHIRQPAGGGQTSKA